ncbi:MAG: phosphoribosylformylglycinamidine synthase subunit PurQ, partial [Patescibacteria group bacterium]
PSKQNSGKFFCDYIKCKIVGSSFFHDETLGNKTFIVPIAHGYGKYVIGKKELQTLKKNGQIFLKYVDFNPNGSVDNIAGVSNKDGNIFGMMPHPERSPEGKYIMRSMEKYVRK